MTLGINVFKEPGSPLCYFKSPLSQLMLVQITPLTLHVSVYYHTTIIQPSLVYCEQGQRGFGNEDGVKKVQ